MEEISVRHIALVENGEVYIEADNDRIWVGELEVIVRVVGGPAWTITYSEAQKNQYPDLDTSDEGLTVDVVDMVHDMTVDASFVTSLQRLPATPGREGELSPRTGLFVGHLLGYLETGLD